MVKRDLSSSLMSLSFMQRAKQREESMKKQEDVKPGGVTATQLGKCFVIMEGDPKPGAIRGRMSFKGFNPLIEKLDEASASPNDDHKRTQSELVSAQNLNYLPRKNYSPTDKGRRYFSKQNQAPVNPDGNRKRKQFEVVSGTQYPSKWHKTNQGYRQPLVDNNCRGSLKKLESRNYFKKPMSINCLKEPDGRNCFQRPECRIAGV